MAFDIETPASIGNIPEANTAVLPADSRILDSYWKNAELKFRQKQLDFDKQKAEADNLLKTLDFDKTGIRPQDLEGITDYAHKNVYEYASENPEALMPSMNNKESLEKANQFSENFGQAKYLANKSKLIKAQYDKYKEAFLNKRDTEGLQALEKWYAQPLDTIGEFDYQPTPDNNVMKLGADWEKAITTGTSAQTTSHKDALGQIVNDTTTTQQIDLSKLPAMAQATYNSDPQWRMEADQAFNILTPEEQKDQYGGNPANVLVDLALPYINAKSDQKKSFRTDWQSQFATKQEAQKQDVGFLVDNVNSLDGLPSLQKTGDTVNPTPSQMSTAFNGMEIVLPGGQKDVITGIFKVGGTLYARPASLQNQDGSIRFEDLYPITNKRNQIAIPYISNAVSKGQMIGTVNEFLNSYDRSAGTEDRTTKSTTQKSVPSATRDEWKAAGWTDTQIDQALKLGKIQVK